MVKVIVSVPLKFSTAPNDTANSSMDTVIFIFSNAVKTNPSSSTSSTNPLKSSTRLLSSTKVKLSGNSIVGASFAGAIVSTKVS